MEESGQILEIETFIPMLLQVGGPDQSPARALCTAVGKCTGVTHNLADLCQRRTCVRGAA